MQQEEVELSPTSRFAGLRTAILIVGVVGGLGLALASRLGVVAPPAGLSVAGLSVAGVMVCMASLWVLEGMPLAATALLPVALFPLLGVDSAKAVAGNYMNSIIMLLMGGFFLAKGLEHWKVSVTLARVVERWAGGSALRLLGGLMGVTAFLSMWLSNTATTLVMTTVATAAIARAKESAHNRPEDVRRFSIALLLGIAYASNMGGLATPVGTAPNAILLGVYAETVGQNPFSFLSWMIVSIPVVLVMTPLMGVLLAKVLSPFPSDLDLGGRGSGDVDNRELKLSRGGRRALAIFVLTALLWVFRKELDLSAFTIPGWASALGLEKLVDDGAVAMMGVALMFAVPSGEAPGERVLSWETARAIPWYLLLLFGGGLALAGAFSSTGLSAWLGDQLVWLKGTPALVTVFILCLGMSFLTEVTSNTATTTLLLPVLASAAVSLELPPLLLMWPATLCASAAFILPISTPPNAIAAGAGNISVPEMARVGFLLNLIAVVTVTIAAMWWLPLHVEM